MADLDFVTIARKWLKRFCAATLTESTTFRSQGLCTLGPEELYASAKAVDEQSTFDRNRTELAPLYVSRSLRLQREPVAAANWLLTYATERQFDAHVRNEPSARSASHRGETCGKGGETSWDSAMEDSKLSAPGRLPSIMVLSLTGLEIVISLYPLKRSSIRPQRWMRSRQVQMVR
ncbi:MAG: hypothetical protein M1816_001565 [Peltula sp. TS41687]|nr:MAG: hypothetical protein M1816_001565 [Peltula sp. TS41687]